MFNSNYATIKEGVNKITAKLSCIDDPSNNLTKYYSVNITGMKAETTTLGNQPQSQQSINKTGKTSVPHITTLFTIHYQSNWITIVIY